MSGQSYDELMAKIAELQQQAEAVRRAELEAVIADMADEVLLFGDGRIVGHHRNETRKPPSELSW